MTSASKVFAGVGALKTPNGNNHPIGEIMGKMAYQMCYAKDWVMTSSGRSGAESFFEQGLYAQNKDPFETGRLKRFIPYLGYNQHTKGVVIAGDDLLSKARKMLMDMEIYPKDKQLPRFIELEGEDRNSLSEAEITVAHYHCLNVFLVLQDDLQSPVDMLVCWTPDGAVTKDEYQIGVTGSSGIAISLANALGKPVFNMKREDHLKRICAFTGISINQPRSGVT